MNEQQEQPRGFNPSEHLIQLKSKQGPQDYLPVKWRIVWYRAVCGNGTIETELVHLDLEKKIAVFKAIVADGNGALAMGHGSECEKDFFDYIEKAETKAIGRALAALGFGTQFTGDELDEGARLVDAPLISTHTVSSDVTGKQVEDLRALCRHLGKQIAKPKTATEADNMIQDLTQEWNEMQAKKRAS